ncbi:MAG: hypothetical protein WDN69_33955 [Aliidongia sp.]
MASCATPARPLALLTLLTALAGCANAPGTAATVAAAGNPEARTAQYFASLTPDSAERLAFLKAMPKGGDLHNHLVGAIYARAGCAGPPRTGSVPIWPRRASSTRLATPPTQSCRRAASQRIPSPTAR